MVRPSKQVQTNDRKHIKSIRPCVRETRCYDHCKLLSNEPRIKIAASLGLRTSMAIYSLGDNVGTLQKAC